MNTRRVSSVFAVLTLAAVAANGADAPLVKQYTTSADLTKVAGYQQVFVAGPDFRTAAMVDVTADPNQGGQPVQSASDAKRASNNSTAAVTVAVGKVIPAGVQPAETMAADSSQRIAFKQSWNSAQGWATMRGNGMPFLDLQTFGKATASGTASWNAKVVMPQANGLFVDFTLPSVKVMGTVESDGPSTYKGRFRAELLVNGHSVWTSEGHRLNYLHTNDPNECTATSEKSNALLDYGAPTGLASTPATPAPGKKVTLGLGQFAAGQAVEVTLVVRADTAVNRKCCIKTVDGVQESFCTGAVTQVAWEESPNPVAFRTGATF